MGVAPTGKEETYRSMVIQHIEGARSPRSGAKVESS
jgi:hypothetical protein